MKKKTLIPILTTVAGVTIIMPISMVACANNSAHITIVETTKTQTITDDMLIATFQMNLKDPLEDNEDICFEKLTSDPNWPFEPMREGGTGGGSNPIDMRCSVLGITAKKGDSFTFSVKAYVYKNGDKNNRVWEQQIDGLKIIYR